MNTLLIGNTSSETYVRSKRTYPNAQLLSYTNFSEFFTESSNVYFTALGDLNFDQIVQAALQAVTVEYLNDLVWNDNCAFIQTEILCNHISQFRPIVGKKCHDIRSYITADISRIGNQPMLWTFGCSHTKGVGLINPNLEVYGSILSSKIELPWKNVAQEGASTKWSLMHLLAADIQPHDIVVWATTSPYRYRHGIDFVQTKEITLNAAGLDAINFYSDAQIYWDHLDTIISGVAYLRALNARFVLMSLMPQTLHRQPLELQLSTCREWCPILDFYSYDLGTDNIHIGPKGHINLAQRIENHLKLLNYV